MSSLDTNDTIQLSQKLELIHMNDSILHSKHAPR